MDKDSYRKAPSGRELDTPEEVQTEGASGVLKKVVVGLMALQ